MACQLNIAYREDLEESSYIIAANCDLFGIARVRTSDSNKTIILPKKNTHHTTIKSATQKNKTLIKIDQNSFMAYIFPSKEEKIIFNNKTVEGLIFLYLFQNEPPKGFELPPFPG